MDSPERLELSNDEFGIRAEAFFRLMTVREFQEEFLRDPSAVVAREFRLAGVDGGQIDERNELVHRLLTDPAFNEWAAEFQQRVQEEFPPLERIDTVDDVLAFVRAKENRDRLMAEFSESALRHLAPGSYEELLRDGGLRAPLVRAEPDIAVVPLTFIAIIVVVVVVAARGRTIEQISRLNVQAVINQLTPDQIELVREARGGST